jgi:hypothetical protein
MNELDLHVLETVTGGRCLRQAKREAINFSAGENHSDPATIKAIDSRSFGIQNGRRYYGVRLDNGENINVGLTRRACRLREINYVTDGA